MAKARARTTNARPRGGMVNRLVAFLTLAALVPVSLPTILVLFCAMLPTLVSAFAERGDNRYAWICVGGLNFAGVAPWLFTLWFGHHTMQFALEVVTNVTMLVVAYGAAAGGWLIYAATPPVVATVMSATSQHRAVRLAAQKRKLIEEWGDAVTTPDELI